MKTFTAIKPLKENKGLTNNIPLKHMSTTISKRDKKENKKIIRRIFPRNVSFYPYSN